jgi:hypothetical protein
MYCRLKWLSTDVSEVRTASVIREHHFTRQYIPEDNSEHHTRRRENLKSHILIYSFLMTFFLCEHTYKTNVKLQSLKFNSKFKSLSHFVFLINSNGTESPCEHPLFPEIRCHYWSVTNNKRAWQGGSKGRGREDGIVPPRVRDGASTSDSLWARPPPARPINRPP